MEDTDFTSMSFHFSGYVPGADTTELTLNEAKLTEAEQELSHLPYSYELGEVIREDLNGNGIVDAGVEIERYQGNGYDARWYMWIATEDGPEQSPMPFARTASCGDAVDSVTPVNGGLEVHEFLREPGDDAPCSDRGSGERTRVVNAEYLEGTQTWWPVRTDPYPAFGGVCPAPRGEEGYPVSTHHTYLVPDEKSAPLSERDPTLDEFPEGPNETMVLGSYDPSRPQDKLYPGWVGVVIKGDRDNLGCAWAPVGD